jgi:diguanylate cyclase (GGDEF)-like protein
MASDLLADDLDSLIRTIYKTSSEYKLDQILQLAAEELRSQIGVDFCAVFRWDRGANDLNLIAVASPPEKSPPPSWHQPYDLQDYPLTAAVLEAGRPVQCSIDDPELDPGEKVYMTEAGISTLLMLPLIIENQTIGLIKLMDILGGRTFKPRAVSLGKLLAMHMTMAIERARLLKETEQRAAELAAFHQASLSLTASLDLPEVLDAILQSTMALISGSEGAHIFLFTGDRLNFGAALWEGGQKGAPFAEPREDGLTYTVARSGETLVVQDMRKHLLYKTAPPSWTGSIVGLPLKFGDRVVGVMNVANRHPNAFSESALRVLRLLGDQAAIAIENARLHNLVIEQARTDITTGLFNRRALDQRLEEEVRRAGRYKRSFALIMMDLDNFKQVNDTFGHPIGDRVLRQIGRHIGSLVRETDFLARFGGDEFALVLAETDRAAGQQMVERIQKAVADCLLDTPKPRTVQLTVSAGLAIFPQDATNATDLLVAADQALYREKENE